MNIPSKPRTAPEPDIWHELTSGELKRELRAALKVLSEECAALAPRYEAHAPLGEAFLERVTDKLALEVAHQAQRRRFARLGVITAAASIAAVSLLTLVVTDHAVPNYDLTVMGGIATTRGASEAPPTIVTTGQSELEIVLRPHERVKGDVVLSAYLLSAHGAFALRGTPEVDASGAFRLVGTVERLFGAPYGDYVLTAVVARKPLSADEVSARKQRGDASVEETNLHIEHMVTPTD